MTAPARTGLDGEALRRGIEDRDLEAIMGLFADDAELRLVDTAHPPSRPLELRGRAAIAGHYRDVCSRDMTHRIERLLLGRDCAAFTEVGRYPDGTRVVGATLLELREGRIAREVSVQARDEWAALRWPEPATTKEPDP